MDVWNFRDYVSARGANEIRTWLNSLPRAARARIDVRLGRMAKLPMERWPTGRKAWARKLKGFDGILEVRVTCENVQYRPLACLGPLGNEITLLMGATERDDEFVPKSAPDTAVDRREIVLQERGRSCEHEYEK